MMNRLTRELFSRSRLFVRSTLRSQPHSSLTPYSSDPPSPSAPPQSQTDVPAQAPTSGETLPTPRRRSKRRIRAPSEISTICHFPTFRRRIPSSTSPTRNSSRRPNSPHSRLAWSFATTPLYSPQTEAEAQGKEQEAGGGAPVWGRGRGGTSTRQFCRSAGGSSRSCTASRSSGGA
jgi:hypothetical protein